MASYTQKITRLLKAIEDQIGFLIPTAVVTHAFDANSDECLAIAFSGQTHRVRGKPETAPACGAVDGLGLTQRVYVPTVIQVGIDISAEGAGLDADTELARTALYVIVSSKNTRCQIFAKSAIALADMIDGDASLLLNYSYSVDGTGIMGNQ